MHIPPVTGSTVMRRRCRKDIIATLIFVYLGICGIISISKVPFFTDEILQNQNAINSLDISKSFKSRKLFVEESKENCTPPAIEQFPRPLMSYQTRKDGGLIVHVLVALYMFLGLAIVCDEYFVPSLGRICEVLNMESDVAGATFMAAGSSAPELATAVIAVFVAKDDIGVGTVVGSAVYNIAFVISICGLFAGRTVFLNWWPLCRDSFFYLISIVALLCTIYNESVTWYESIILLFLYAIYIAFMFVNHRVEKWLRNSSFLAKCFHWDKVAETNSMNGYKPISENGIPLDQDLCEKGPHNSASSSSSPYSQMEIEPEAPWERPEGKWKSVLWIVSLPIGLACYITVPDSRKQKWKKLFLISFLLSCVWISALSYVLVWMITIIGSTLHIPDTVMGLTFLAAGVSVPDAIASLLVVRDGYGDMAVSNAVGSNVFDILLCLGLPWFLQTALVRPGSEVVVRSKGLTYSTICLLSTVVFLLLATHMNGWKLDKKYGCVLMLWYVGFMVLASLYELNIFGAFNPSTCPTNY